MRTENFGFSIEAFEGALVASELDYTINPFEAIVPVDASERERRSEKTKATVTMWPS